MKRFFACMVVLAVAMGAVFCGEEEEDSAEIDGALIGSWDRTNPATASYVVATSSDITINGTSLSESNAPYDVVNALSGQIYLTYNSRTLGGLYPAVYLYDYLVAGDTLYLVADLDDTLCSPIRTAFGVSVCLKQ